MLPITVDDKGNNRIKIVTEKARAGYLNGDSDPDYIESLQQMALPFLGLGKYRAFPVEGDSMPPHKGSDIMIGRYVESIGEVQKG